MNAEIFLTCFLACLFAFVAILVLTLQLLGWLLRRWIAKNLPEILKTALGPVGLGVDDAAGRQELIDMMQKAATLPPLGVCLCGATLSVPADLFVRYDDIPKFFQEHDWKFVGTDWRCPQCLAK